MSSPSSDFIFLNEEFDEEPAKPQEFWDVLIVDDDSEIHSVTELALSNFELNGKGLRFHHAFNGTQAVDILRDNPLISVVLLDVVMESDDAGLIVAKRVREELKNHVVRIVLRTGQPGYAPEEQIIRQYDINDYRTKTELTRSKLATTMVTALRSHQQVTQLSMQSHALSQVLLASEQILNFSQLLPLSRAAIKHLAHFTAGPQQGVVCGLDDDGVEIVYGGTGEHQNVHHQHLEESALTASVKEQIKASFKLAQHQHNEHSVSFFFRAKQQQYVICLEGEHIIEHALMQYIDLLLTNVGVGLDNVLLVDRLRNVAFKDSLTGLCSRNGFIAALERLQKNTNAHDYLVLIDIARFADINEGLSHDIGNLLLVAVAQRLQAQHQQTQVVARLGADLFAVVSNEEQLPFAQLHQLLRAPFIAAEHQLHLNFTFGLCTQPHFDSSALGTLKRASIALSHAKADISHSYCYFDKQMEEQVSHRLAMIRRLREDFADGKLEVWYQPQVDLATAQPYGCEALLRWPIGQGQFISPAVFVPLAEDAGMIIEIGQWVLEQACAKQRELAQHGVDMQISVNVSVPQFKASDYAQSVAQTLARFAVPSDKIELEITESVVMDEVEQVTRTLNELKSYGIDVAIDDFGTGFCSLSYLHKLPFDRLKIDRAFVKGIPEQDNGEIAELVVSLANRMNLRVIAEGIETEQQLEFLKSIGCHEGQGYYYAQPLDGKKLDTYLKVSN